MLEKRDHSLVVEVAITDVVADLDAHMTSLHAPLQLAAGCIGILEWYLRERQQAAVARLAQLQGKIVHDAGDLLGLAHRSVVGEEDGGGGDHLHRDAVCVHVGEPDLGVPAVRADPAELLRAHHDHRVTLGLDLEPRSAVAEVGPAARHVVRVDVDDVPGLLRHASQPLPGWSAPQLPQVRASSEA